MRIALCSAWPCAPVVRSRTLRPPLPPVPSTLNPVRNSAIEIVSEPPEFYFRRQVYSCFFRDNFGLKNLQDIGVDNVTFETDYPHSDSTWPDTKKVAEEMFAGLDDETGLLAELTDEGGDLVTLRAIVEEASDLGAARVLSRMGLADDHAPTDMAELRQLLGAWRDAKASAWKAAIGWVVRAVLALLLFAIAVRLGSAELVR